MGSINFLWQFKIKKRQETRSERQEAKAKSQEARGKKRETRTKRQEARDKKPVCRQAGKKQEIALFAVRFLCVSAPLRAKRKKNQEPRGLSLVS
jgi:hypothetical protein